MKFSILGILNYVRISLLCYIGQGLAWYYKKMIGGNYRNLIVLEQSFMMLTKEDKSYPYMYYLIP